MHNQKVYIVILNYLQWQDTRDCIESVLRSSYPNYSVIIIDNNSQNNSLEHLVDWVQTSRNKTFSSGDAFLPGKAARQPIFPGEMVSKVIDWVNLPLFTFIQNEKNAGFAGGNNIVLDFLAGLDGYVWLLNPDMIIKEDALTELISYAAGQTTDCIIGAEVRSYSGKQELFFYGGGRVNYFSGTVQLIKDPEAVDRLDYISGGCLFTRAANFKKWGLLPEEYFLYWEETDWCFRAKQQGASLVVCTSAVCYDKISTVIGKGFMSDYYYSRNGLLFISKFYKKNIPIALFLMSLRWLKRIFVGQWGRARGIRKGAIDFLKKNFNEGQ